MKKITLASTFLLFIFSCFSTHLFAQTVNVSGQIIDQKSKEPLISATVRAGGIGTTTDLDGNFNIDLTPGNYTLSYSYVGYETGNMDIQVKENQNCVIRSEHQSISGRHVSYFCVRIWSW